MMSSPLGTTSSTRTSPSRSSELSGEVPIITTAKTSAAVDILKLAGSSTCRAVGHAHGSIAGASHHWRDAGAHVIGQFEELLIAEATAAGTPLIGKTLAETPLREMVGMNVLGVGSAASMKLPGPRYADQPQHRAGPGRFGNGFVTTTNCICIYHQSLAPASHYWRWSCGPRHRRSGRARMSSIVSWNSLAEHIAVDADRYIIGDAAESGDSSSSGHDGRPRHDHHVP
jgi:hypothetical protein